MEQNLNFVLISGDLFDSAYPPIEILKESFAEFKKLNGENLPGGGYATMHLKIIPGNSNCSHQDI